MPPRNRTTPQPPLTTSAVDPRHPDTTADQGDVVRPADPVELADMDPAGYGFRDIDTEGAVEAYKAGPGFVEPTVMPSVSSQNSTFAERAAARRKVVSGTDEGVGTK